MREVSFKVTDADRKLIDAIARRAVEMAKRDHVSYTLIDVKMDVTAVHANMYFLRLAELLGADDFNFAHDIYGIRNTLDRRTGELMNCFEPRFTDGAWLVELESKKCKDCKPDVAMCDAHSLRWRSVLRSREINREFRRRQRGRQARSRSPKKALESTRP